MSSSSIRYALQAPGDIRDGHRRGAVDPRCAQTKCDPVGDHLSPEDYPGAQEGQISTRAKRSWANGSLAQNRVKGLAAGIFRNLAPFKMRLSSRNCQNLWGIRDDGYGIWLPALRDVAPQRSGIREIPKPRDPSVNCFAPANARAYPRMICMKHPTSCAKPSVRHTPGWIRRPVAPKQFPTD